MGTTVDGKRRTNSRYRASDGPGYNYYGERGYSSIGPGWSGSHEQTIKGQRKQAIDLCYVPDKPTSRYHTDILFDGKPSGTIWFSGGTWRVTIGQHDYGRFKTYLGARKYAYEWYSGLDIVPGELPDMPDAQEISYTPMRQSTILGRPGGGFTTHNMEAPQAPTDGLAGDRSLSYTGGTFIPFTVAAYLPWGILTQRGNGNETYRELRALQRNGCDLIRASGGNKAEQHLFSDVACAPLR